MSGGLSGGEETDAAAADEELARLRALVGPDERTLDDLRRDLDGALEAQREAERARAELERTIPPLEQEVQLLERDYEWFRAHIDRLRRVRWRGRSVWRRVRNRVSRKGRS